MNQLRVFWTFFRLGAMNELAYRVNFFTQIFQAIMSLVLALGGLAVVFNQTDSLAGWYPTELIALVGIYLLVGGLINLMIQPSMQRFMEDIRMGTLDFMILKPEDAQFLVSVRQIEIWKLIDIVMGLAVLVVALVRLGTQLGVVEAISFGIALLAGATIVYSFWMMLATCAFWFVKTENILVIFQSMYQAGRWPITIYPGWLQMMLTFLVPIAFAVTVPAQALTGRLTGQTLLLAVLVAVVLFALARWFWRYGIRFYAGASA
ncbi:MAG TPA: ABC-2 family transporter protein [Caldilineaceae bacterium]|nr:ABC-2 family transporter protein [Caldilineaceae bacterium]